MNHARAILFYAVIAIFVATAAVTLLGVVGVVEISETYLKVLFTSLIVELAVAVVGLFKATDWFGADVTAPIEAVRGGWWQFVRAPGDNALSYIEIGFSESERQPTLEGWAFTPGGDDYAHYQSIAASLNGASLTLYYIWRGDHRDADDDFSGVGRLDFARTPRVEWAMGWFTSGDLDRGKVTSKRKVEMRRATPEEARTMRPGGEPLERRQLACAMYANWQSTASGAAPGTAGPPHPRPAHPETPRSETPRSETPLNE